MSWIALPLSVDPVAFVSILVGNLNDPSRAEPACSSFLCIKRDSDIGAC